MKTASGKEMIRIVHCKKDSYDVYIGRGSRWGNPFRIGKDGNRSEVIMKYADWLRTQPELLSSVHELKDKVLGCWCAPAGGVTRHSELVCHGQILAEAVEGRIET